MRGTRPTTTQTTCDCEDCPSFTITGHFRRTTEQADRHHLQAAVDGWQDVEARDYCPGCPPGLPVEEHDHAGLWAS